MQKTKFHIKGMHCQSCATLIEEKLKDLKGIIKSKINYGSGKGVIIYDEKKLDELVIQKTIKSAGDYQISKIEDDFGQEERKINFSVTPKKIMFLLIILIGFSLVNLGSNFVLLNKLNKFSSGVLVADNNQKIVQKQNQEQNSPPDNSQPSPTEKVTAQFEITKDNHIRGDFEAPITLVEFSDFECPFCEKHYPTMNKILADYTGKIRLVYKHFPLGFHPNAQKAAESSECASEQGKFWEYHDKLFDNFQTGYSIENFKKWAGELSLNTKKFNDCLDSGKYAQKIQTDSQEGGQKGVQGTPATFVNGQLVSGALPYESFKQIIDSLLK